MDKVCSKEYKLHLKFSDKISSRIHMRVVLKAWKMQDWRCHGKQLKIWHRWSPCRPLLEAVKIKTDEKEKSVGYYRCKDHGTFIREDWKSTVYTNERVCLLQGAGLEDWGWLRILTLSWSHYNARHGMVFSCRILV